MKKLLEKVLEYQGPIERYKQSGLTIIYFSQDLKDLKEIVFPDNVIHSFLPPVDENFISNLETKSNIRLPKIYKELVKICNGFSLASGYLSFEGLSTGLWKGFTHKEKTYLGDDVIRRNQLLGPKNIVKRFFLIGKNYFTNEWIGIKDEKIYLISSRGKQLSELNSFDIFIPLVEQINNNSEKTIKHIKQLYKLND